MYLINFIVTKMVGWFLLLLFSIGLSLLLLLLFNQMRSGAYVLYVSVVHQGFMSAGDDTLFCL